MSDETVSLAQLASQMDGLRASVDALEAAIDAALAGLRANTLPRVNVDAPPTPAPMIALLNEHHAEIMRMLANSGHALSAGFDRIDARLDAIDGRFDGVDARFDRIDDRFDRIKATLGEILSRLPPANT